MKSTGKGTGIRGTVPIASRMCGSEWGLPTSIEAGTEVAGLMVVPGSESQGESSALMVEIADECSARVFSELGPEVDARAGRPSAR
jgi:hypothetical protein